MIEKTRRVNRDTNVSLLTHELRSDQIRSDRPDAGYEKRNLAPLSDCDLRVLKLPTGRADLFLCRNGISPGLITAMAHTAFNRNNDVRKWLLQC